ncbi:MAG TPA: GAF domain-containing protein [Actinomycetota bacterium]|nr:GAF domain-containing protein [Actinomycetota bacterium]
MDVRPTGTLPSRAPRAPSSGDAGRRPGGGVADPSRAPGATEGLADLFERASDAMFTTDLSGNFTSINRAGERLTGFARGQIRAMNAAELVAPSDRNVVRQLLAAAALLPDRDVARKIPARHELDVLTSRGNRVPVEVSLTLIHRDGEPVGVLGIAREVGERHRAEAQLRRRNEELEALSATALDLVSGLEPGTILDGAVGRASEVMSTPHAWLSVLDERTGEIVVRVGSGLFEGWIGFRQDRGLGLDALVWERGRAVAVERYAAWPSRMREFDGAELGPMAATPLRSGGEVVGIIGVARMQDDRPFTEDELRILQRLGDLASLALHNARLYSRLQDELVERGRAEEELHRRNDELEVLHQTTLGLLEGLDLEPLLRSVVARAAELVDTEHGYLYVLEPGSGEMVMRVGTGRVGDRWKGTRIRRGDGLAGRVWDDGRTLTVDDYRTWGGRLPAFDEVPLRAVTGTPLHAEGRVIGVIGVARLEPGRSFTASEIGLLERFGKLAALAIHNAGLYRAARQELAERRRAEEALRRREAQLAEAQHIAHIGSWEWDIPANVVTWSDELYRIFGLGPQEFAATYESYLDRIHPDDRDRVHAAVTAAWSGGGEFSFDHRVVRPDGTVRTVHANGRALLDDDGRVVRMTGTGQDVTERTESEDVLRRRNAQLEALHRTALALIERLDPTELLQDIVSRAAALVGTEHGYAYVVEPPGDAMVARVGIGAMGGEYLGLRVGRGEGLAGRVWERGETMTVEDYRGWSGRRPQFDPVRIRAVAGVPLRSDGEVVGVIGVVRMEDGRSFTAEEIQLLEWFAELASLALHNARSYEREREAAEHLRALDEMKNAFLEAVSHDLRTPLTSVLGFALTLSRPDLNASPVEEREMLEMLVTNARKLERLLTDLLDLDRLMRGVLEPHRRPTDLRALVERVIAESDLRGRPVRMDAPSRVAWVDPAKVERIIENLVVNSVRHTPSGTPLWVRLWDEGEGVVVAVEDAGPGVPERERDTIFEPFRQGSASPSHSPGTGIGLSLVARFAELHGGRAWVQDREGGGASFRVLLPTESRRAARAR